MGGISVLAIVALFLFSSSRIASFNKREDPLPLILLVDLLLTDLGRCCVFGWFCLLVEDNLLVDKRFVLADRNT
jgi:hypothetical protein